MEDRRPISERDVFSLPSPVEPSEPAVDEVELYVTRLVDDVMPHLTLNHLERIRDALPSYMVQSKVDIDVDSADFLPGEFVSRQLAMVRGMTDALFPNGRPAKNVDMLDMRNVISASKQAIDTMMKYLKPAKAQDRLRKLEHCVVTVLAKESQELKDRVIADLEAALEELDA